MLTRTRITRAAPVDIFTQQSFLRTLPNAPAVTSAYITPDHTRLLRTTARVDAGGLAPHAALRAAWCATGGGFL
jgi:hypothetical protein